MADQKLIATTVSSRATGMQRRINQLTTSSHDEKKQDKNVETSAETCRIHISFKRKDNKKQFSTRVEENTQKNKKKAQQQALETQCHRRTEKRKQQKEKGLNTGSADGKGKDNSSKASHQDRNKEPQKKTTFIVLQKNTRSLSSSERLEKMISELHRVEWDAILISETWRQTKEYGRHSRDTSW